MEREEDSSNSFQDIWECIVAVKQKNHQITQKCKNVTQSKLNKKPKVHVAEERINNLKDKVKMSLGTENKNSEIMILELQGLKRKP